MRFYDSYRLHRNKEYSCIQVPGGKLVQSTFFSSMWYYLFYLFFLRRTFSHFVQEVIQLRAHVCRTVGSLASTLFIFYKNLVYKNIKASNCPKIKNILRTYEGFKF